ncbi:hypothetical protein [Paenibacillus soyae]|uniref:Uncharacterized protein n=1 Tax=Paenibacillus soyae TaxID=2969249 RepID=A0A9X2MVA7_9BACL|nr:hypothetical protein [Paenibacillus soyae]MCR2804222.1 hypothetical protein [Paenibacillus soyae]
MSDCCDCVKGMAEQLKRFDNFFSTVFEGENNQTQVFGTIRRVIDDEILHMENGTKQIATNFGFISFGFTDIYISICKINEFIPQFEVTAANSAQVTETLNAVSQNTNPTVVL